MKRRKWTPEQKVPVVLEGLRGRPVGEVCAEHAVSQALEGRILPEGQASAWLQALESEVPISSGSFAKQPGLLR